MYAHIGRKLQILAKITCAFGVVASVAYGTICICNARGVTENVVIGAAHLVVGALVSWLGSWATYAFGQVVEDVHRTANQK